MEIFSHRGAGWLQTCTGEQAVDYLLTVTRTSSQEEGFGHVQAKGIDFRALVDAGEPLNLRLEPGGTITLNLTTAAGERAIFATAATLPSWLFKPA